MKQTLDTVVLDTRPIFQSGGSPCSAIEEAASDLRPGQMLVLLVPFEPVPLYGKLAAYGLSHEATQLEDGTWRIEFRRTGRAVASPPALGGCGCHTV